MDAINQGVEVSSKNPWHISPSSKADLEHPHPQKTGKAKGNIMRSLSIKDKVEQADLLWVYPFFFISNLTTGKTLPVFYSLYNAITGFWETMTLNESTYCETMSSNCGHWSL